MTATDDSDAAHCRALLALAERLFMPLLNTGWPVGKTFRHRPWRVGLPAAFRTGWHGGRQLSADQMEWFHEREAYARVQEEEWTDCDTGEVFRELYLVVFDQRMDVVPAVLFHATPSRHVDAILSKGLLTGLVSGVLTTNFPESERRIHFYDTASHCKTEWLDVAVNCEKIPAGEYTILRIDPMGVRKLLLDPCSVCGYVTDEPVGKLFISVSDYPIVVVGD